MADKMVLTEYMSILIREARLNKGMKLNEVCEYVGNGLDLPKLSRIENHKCKYIRIEHVRKLNELFDISMRDNYDIEASLIEQIHRQRDDINSLREEIIQLKRFIHEQFEKQVGCCDGNGTPLTFTYSGDIDPSYFITEGNRSDLRN